MAAGDIRDELPERADWAVLFQLKQEWQVSMAALLMRARTLGRMSGNNSLSLPQPRCRTAVRTGSPGRVPGSTCRPACLGEHGVARVGDRPLAQ
jgi:Zn-dependent peptidase ImmA (M78 family)